MYRRAGKDLLPSQLWMVVVSTPTCSATFDWKSPRSRDGCGCEAYGVQQYGVVRRLRFRSSELGMTDGQRRDDVAFLHPT